MRQAGVFTALDEAIRAGFVVDSRTADGYRVRRRTSGGWAFALVVLRHG